MAQLQPSVTETGGVLADPSCIELFKLESILQSPFQIIKYSISKANLHKNLLTSGYLELEEGMHPITKLINTQ